MTNEEQVLRALFKLYISFNFFFVFFLKIHSSRALSSLAYCAILLLAASMTTYTLHKKSCVKPICTLKVGRSACIDLWECK